MIFFKSYKNNKNYLEETIQTLHLEEIYKTIFDSVNKFDKMIEIYYILKLNFFYMFKLIPNFFKSCKKI